MSPYKSYGTKLLSLFARLLFSRQSHSLSELARMLDCSKQTVLRLVDDIRKAYGVEIEEQLIDRRKYFKIAKSIDKGQALPLTAEEVATLRMCKAFAEHLLGPELLKQASNAIDKSIAGAEAPFADHFSAFQFGRIDYTPHQEVIQNVLRAMREKRICDVAYKAGYNDEPKQFFIKPLRLFAFKDTLYLCTQLARRPGQRTNAKQFDPLLALHRIQSLAITDRQFEYPKNFDFEKLFKSEFGLIKGEPFSAEVEFSGWAAAYIRERIWCANQNIHERENGKILLRIKVTSDVEFLSWVLSFGENIQVLKPKVMTRRLKIILGNIAKMYGV